jgi:hypothetical protein
MRRLWILASLLLAGCGPTFVPQPHALSSESTVRQDAQAWAIKSPNRYHTNVAATGSMEPFLNEHSILLVEKYHGQPFKIGAVAIFRHSEAHPRVVHTVSDQNETHVYMSGYANKNSDGWFPKTSIEGFVVGQLYLP